MDAVLRGLLSVITGRFPSTELLMFFNCHTLQIPTSWSFHFPPAPQTTAIENRGNRSHSTFNLSIVNKFGGLTSKIKYCIIASFWAIINLLAMTRWLPMGLLFLPQQDKLVDKEWKFLYLPHIWSIHKIVPGMILWAVLGLTYGKKKKCNKCQGGLMNLLIQVTETK